MDEGVLPDQTLVPEGQIRQQLDQQSNVSLGPHFRLSLDRGIVTVTNAPEASEPDIQYPVVAPFLSHLSSNVKGPLLESAARLFTAALVGHLLSPKTLTLKFHVPESSPWSAILPAHHRLLKHENTAFTIGALHLFSSQNDEPPATHRVCPFFCGDTLATARRAVNDTFRVFTVVLDRPNFVSEAGVYFYMDERDKDEWDDAEDTQVLRCPGMHEAARRLAMLVVEDQP